MQLKNNEGKNVTVAIVYRPPAQPVDINQEIYEQIMEISLIQEVVIIGDLNLPVSKWGDPISSHAGQDLYMDLQES